MVSVRESYTSGNRLIIVRIEDEDDPHVYTADEAEELHEQLGELL